MLCLTVLVESIAPVVIGGGGLVATPNRVPLSVDIEKYERNLAEMKNKVT